MAPAVSSKACYIELSTAFLPGPIISLLNLSSRSSRASIPSGTSGPAPTPWWDSLLYGSHIEQHSCHLLRYLSSKLCWSYLPYIFPVSPSLCSASSPSSLRCSHIWNSEATSSESPPFISPVFLVWPSLILPKVLVWPCPFPAEAPSLVVVATGLQFTLFTQHPGLPPAVVTL